MNNINTILDLDILDSKNSLSKSNYINIIIDKVQSILNKRFDDRNKHHIKIHTNRINFACPYCGDSMKNSNKKRGNIILEGKHSGFYKCFNCSVFKTVTSFFSDYKVSLDLDIIDYISNHLGDLRSSFSEKYDISLLLDIELIEKYAIDRQELIKKFMLVEIIDSPVRSWLRSRLQFQEEKFLYNPAKNYLLILNLTPSGKILGFQKRGFNLKSYEPKYLTYKLSKISEGFKMGKIPEEFDSISVLFNITLLNFNMPITLFEGGMDSFLFKNSIALSGVNKIFPIDIPIRYWFDKDLTGVNQAIKKLENKQPVFLWERFIRDYNIPYSKKLDLNDILIYFKKNNIKTPLFENYFSDDPLDLIDI